MCGIFGRLNLPVGGPLSPELCRRQTDSLRHRGPDAGGYLMASSLSGACSLSREGELHAVAWTQAAGWDLFLGHRRLAILDLSQAAAQPMQAVQGRYWITFNGEIYNFQEIRRELTGLGAAFRTSHSDTEVLLLAFIHWGEACLARLRGMFAFGVLDLQGRRLFLARDRLGKKPLYYRAAPEGFQFASELKAIVADPAVPREIDPVALGQYLLYGYVPAPRTIYRGIAKLPPAHYAWVDLERPHDIHPRRYWDLQWGEATDAGTDWREEFAAELAEAVRLRLVSDVPLGAFSSGGLDSTLVVREMQQASAGPVKTFAIGFPEVEASELPWAGMVARRYRTDHTEEVVRPDALDLLPHLVHHFDEPFGDSSAIPTWIVSHLARRRVTVALSGDGGDEIMAGYRRYFNAQRLEHLFGPLPAGLKRPLFHLLALVWPAALRGKGFWRRAAAGDNLYQAMMAREGNLALLHPELGSAAVAPSDLHAHFRAPWERGPADLVSRLQYVDLHTYLPEDILVKADRASMAASLELRCPLLDHRLVELAARLPRSAKFAGQEQKVLIRELLTADLGPGFVNRPKNGFQMPLKHWFNGNLREILQDRLLSPENPLFQLCQRPGVARLAHRFIRGQRDLSEDLWRLLVLGEWCRQVYQG